MRWLSAILILALAYASQDAPAVDTKVASISSSLVSLLRRFQDGAPQTEVFDAITDIEKSIYEEADKSSSMVVDSEDSVDTDVANIVAHIDDASGAIAELKTDLEAQKVFFTNFDSAMYAQNIPSDAALADIEKTWMENKEKLARAVTTVQIQMAELQSTVVTGVQGGLGALQARLPEIGSNIAHAIASNKNTELLAKILLLADVKKKCEKIDMCKARHPCQNGGKCTSTADNLYTCECLPGFKGASCEINIDDCASTSGDLCLNGGTCVDGINSYACTCLKGYTGDSCQENIQECNLLTHACSDHGQCVDGIGTSTCTCYPGFMGDNCEIDIDECQPQPCQNGAVCVQGDNSYGCLCKAGFQGKNCEIDIDECAPKPCQNGAVCTQSIDHYECKCAPGWGGSTCTVQVDMCAQQPGICQNGGKCTPAFNDYTCSCTSGWNGKNCDADIIDCVDRPCTGCTGTTCNDYGQCAAGKTTYRPCGDYGSCVEGTGGYTCNCMAGFSGAFCQTNKDDCSPNPCKNGGTCKDGINMGICTCPTGYTGTNCETAVAQWVKLLDNAVYTGSTQNNYASLAGGYFTDIRVVYRSGFISCSQYLTENEYKWNSCHRNVPQNADVFSFELLKKGAYVLKQESWDRLPTSCTKPTTPAGPILCSVKLQLSTGEILSPSWFGASRGLASVASSGASAGTIYVDLYGLTSTDKISPLPPTPIFTASGVGAALGDSFTWQSAADMCTANKRRLCTYFEICPKGDVDQPRLGKEATDTWVPFLGSAGASNEWVSISATSTCLTASKVSGVAPSWGTTITSRPFKRVVHCCQDQ